MSGYAKRTDQTHREVIDTLRALGWIVKDTHDLPNWVDCVAHYNGGHLSIIEIKTETGKLTKSQQRLLDDGWPIVLIRSRDEAVGFTEQVRRLARS